MAWFGWRWGIGVGAIGAGLVSLLALFALPKSPRNYDDVSRGALLDFRSFYGTDLHPYSILSERLSRLRRRWGDVAVMSTLR